MSVYNDLYLVADTEAEMIAAIPFARGMDGNGSWLTNGPGFSCCALGPICTSPAVLGPDMTVITPAVMDERFHVNLSLFGLGNDLLATIPPAVIVSPNNPRVVWAR